MRQNLGGFAIFTICLSLFAGWQMSRAATIHVPTDYDSVEEAMDSAQSGDSILVGPGTYYLTGDVGLDFDGRAIVLCGESGPEETILDGSTLEPVYANGLLFNGGEDSTTVVRGFTIRNIAQDVAGGTAVKCLWGSSPLLVDLVLEDNNSLVEPFGSTRAALYMRDSAPIIRSCVFRNNGLSGAAGAVGCDNSSPVFTNVQFIGNVSLPSGGAVRLMNGSEGVFTDCSFEHNVAASGRWEAWSMYGAGGAVAMESSTAHFERCSFIGNEAHRFAEDSGSGRGGAIRLAQESEAILQNCTLYGNLAQVVSGGDAGGGIYLWADSRLEIYESIVAFSHEGGGIFGEAPGGEAIFSCCDIYGNVGGDFLGAIADPTGSDGNFSLDPFFCDADVGDLSLQWGSPCLPGNNACGLLVGAFGYDDCGGNSAPGEATPLIIGLYQNHPNPFNPSTEIRFDLPKSSPVHLEIFDLSGRRITGLFRGESLEAGHHRTTWNGCDEAGRSLASGVYFYRLQVDERSETRKMTLLK